MSYTTIHNHLVLDTDNSSQDSFKHKIYRTPAIKKPKRFTATVKTSKPLGDKEDFDLLCINCMKIVKVSLVPEHSLHCVQVQSEVKLIDQCSLIQQADYKLRKLKDALRQLTNDSELLRKNSNNGYYIKMISTYLEDILQITNFTKFDILRCREVTHNLMALTKGFKGSPSVMLHLERLLALSKEKYVQLLKYYKEIAKVGAETIRTKEELKNITVEKSKKLRESINMVSEVRATILSEGRSRYNPERISDFNRKNEVISDGNYTE